MPKLPSLTPKKLIQKLTRLGFVEDHQIGSHKDVPKGTLNSLLKEAGVSREEILR
ncbi:MAG: hypothetical protein AAB656_00550 [Patescibacteria group bacterium]